MSVPAQKRKTTGNKRPSAGKKPTRSASPKTTSAHSKKLGSKISKKPDSRSSARPSARSARAAQQRREAQLKSRNQTFAIVMFAFSIFLFFLVLISGENIWNSLHTVLLGMFGTCSILWPILLTYVAVVTALERPIHTISSKIALSIVIIVLFCAAVYIFSVPELPRDQSYWQQMIGQYLDGVERKGAGMFGGLLGIPFVAALGSIGAKIVIILLLFVFIMILTGTSLIQLFRAVSKPVEVVKETVGTREEREERRDMRREQRRLRQRINPNIDIALDEDVSRSPAREIENRNELPRRNEKLEQLEQAVSAPEPVLDRTPSHTPTSIPEEGPQEESGAAAAAAAFVRRSQKKASPLTSVETTEKLTAEPIQVEPVEGAASYRFPPVALLEPSPQMDEADITEELKINGQMLVDTLKSFGVQTKIVDISRGPAVTRYELQPAAGVKISKITNLADDIALNLAASGVRIEAPIPGKAAVGIEVPNQTVNIVKMRELVDSSKFEHAKSRLTVALGKDIAGNITLADLAKMPHVLIAGSTGSGKSVCINSLIVSLLYKSTPDEVRFLMVDPKVVELGIYNGIPHLLVPVVTDPRKAAGALNWAVREMLDRYKTFAEHNVRDLQGYNRMVENLPEEQNRNEDGSVRLEKMPQIVIIIDELADLMMAAPNEVEDSICRLAQMARAAGMHLVIATQRPSVDVITGIIKANIPSRIAFAVSSAVDSRTILDMGGAEKLLGRGDMLFSPVGSSKPLRVQGCFVTDSEIESVVNYVKSAQDAGYDQTVIEQIEKNAVSEQRKNSKNREDEEEGDPMMKEAIRCVVEAGQASTSLLQRRLHMGYARAGRLIDEMEQMGVVGPHEGSKPRQVLITYQQWLERNLQQADQQEQ
ncbi:MAG: DNA translocase FtsK 4TM domain-containing protein [Clostridium sp.]